VNGARSAGRARLLGAAEMKAPPHTAFLATAVSPWWRAMLALAAVGFAMPLLFGSLGLPQLFFYVDDLPVALLLIVMANSLYLANPRWAAVWRFAPGWRTAALTAAVVVALCWAGGALVYDGYALSMDEFMARFDAQTLSSGRLLAEIPHAWRPYAAALQPKFVRVMADGAYWRSGYLPVNAAFLALGLKFGLESLVPPIWAGLSIVSTFAIARRLWPDRASAAGAAALLLATSPQLLVTAMTPYAMTAHLALNLAWLWLVLRGGRLGHGAAPGVAFLATGLHQMIFAPLFAAPFVLEMWLARRWREAAWHTATYAAVCVFWLIYPALLQHAFAGASVVQAAAGSSGTAGEALGLIRAFRPLDACGDMVLNLLRFATWQSLLTLPLAAAAFVPALRTPGPMRALALGPLLTLAAVFVLMPYQGHGWGYRYLHGYLGSFALLAVAGWMRIGAQAEPQARRAVFAAAAAASLFLLVPVQAWEARHETHPYATAERAIRDADADIVVVDVPAVYLGVDLVRNSPFVDRRPVVLAPVGAPPAGLAQLCRGRTVEWFEPVDARRAGIAGRATPDPHGAAVAEAWRRLCPPTERKPL
jgi:hypothetical protein